MPVFRRMRDEAPPKTTGANAPAIVAAMPAAASPARMTLDELTARNVVGQQALTPFFQSLGLRAEDWQEAPGGYNEDGTPIYFQRPNDWAKRDAAGYTFDWKDTGPANTGTLTAYDPTGKEAGQYFQQDQTAAQGVLEAALLAAAGFGGVGLLGLGPLGGVLGGAGAAGSGAAGGSGAAAGSGAGGLLASVPAETLAALEAATAGLTPASVAAATLPAAGLPGLGAIGAGLGGITVGAAELLPAIEAAGAITPAQVVASSLPASGLPGLGAATAAIPSTFRAALDSQAYNTAAGITGAQAAQAATVPATVNLVNAGGTMATAGGLPGVASLAAQALRDATASSQLGGGLLSQAGGTVANAVQSGAGAAGDLASWMKANPVLGRLAMSGLTGLLSTVGGQPDAPAEGPSGPPVAWNSGIQRGLLQPVQQYAPPALSQPAGLLATGYDNAGAWRFLRG